MSTEQQNLIPAPKNKKQFVRLVKKGQAHLKKREDMEALRYLTSAWKYDDSNTNLLVMIADALFRLGNKSAAMQLMAHTLERNPTDPNIALVLGNAALKMDFFELSQKFHQKYIELKPDDVIGYNNYAGALREAGKLDEAIAFLQDIVPMFAKEEGIWNTLASVVAFRDGPAQAIVFYEECLKLNPKNIQALNNIAPAYLSVGKAELAEETIKKAIKLNPNVLDPHLFLSNLNLVNKRLDQGWDKYSKRPASASLKLAARYNNVPIWKGEELAGKKIIVFGEQGIGDEILFTWLYHELISQAEEVAFSCEHRLVDLFRSSFTGAKVNETRYIVDKVSDKQIMVCSGIDTGDYDFQTTAGDLPKYFWRNYDDIKKTDAPILKPDQSVVDHWKKEIDKLPHKLSVGIAWRSGVTMARRSRHYAQLIDWAHLLKDKDINFINIQYGDCTEELAELEEKTGIKIHDFADLDLKDDFMGATAMMKSLDLVMGPSTSPVHQGAFAGTEAWYFTSGHPWWSFGDEKLRWRQNARVLAKNENDLWPEFMQEKAIEFEKWYHEKLS